MYLAGKLNCKVDVYGKKQVENELGELDYDYGKIKTVWAEIIPQGGNVKSLAGDVSYAQISHKITVRAKSITDLANDMYFMYQNQRYNIKYYQPNYKKKDSIEIMCELVVE